MFNKILAKIVVAILLIIPFVTLANTLTFDTFTRNQGGTHYEGFTFGDRWWLANDPGLPLTFDNNPGTSALIKRMDNSAFVFEGASFWSRAADKSVDVTIDLYDNKLAVINSTSFRLNQSVHEYITSAYTGDIFAMNVYVDGNTVKGNDRNYLAMDNFTFTSAVQPTTPVPEPSTYVLMLIGIAGIMLIKQKSVDI